MKWSRSSFPQPRWPAYTIWNFSKKYLPLALALVKSVGCLGYSTSLLSQPGPCICIHWFCRVSFLRQTKRYTRNLSPVSFGPYFDIDKLGCWWKLLMVRRLTPVTFGQEMEVSNTRLCSRRQRQRGCQDQSQPQLRGTLRRTSSGSWRWQKPLFKSVIQQ